MMKLVMSFECIGLPFQMTDSVLFHPTGNRRRGTRTMHRRLFCHISPVYHQVFGGDE